MPTVAERVRAIGERAKADYDALAAEIETPAPAPTPPAPEPPAADPPPPTTNASPSPPPPPLVPNTPAAPPPVSAPSPRLDPNTVRTCLAHQADGREEFLDLHANVKFVNVSAEVSGGPCDYCEAGARVKIVEAKPPTREPIPAGQDDRP